MNTRDEYEASDLNDNLNQSNISHQMNSICLQTGNFGGNISVVTDNNNICEDIVHNDNTT